MNAVSRRWLGSGTKGACVAALVALAACSSPPPPPPPPPPAAIPSKPLPPGGASANVPVPPLGADGLRVSVNRNISPAQTVWNLRSAFNVAALDCNETTYPDIAPAYRAFLKSFGKQLSAANRKVDAEFRAQYGSGFVAKREGFMTQVYNHYALPPTLDEFCKAVGAVSRDSATVLPKELPEFAQRSLPNIEVVYDTFYRHYADYLADLAAWQTRYGVPPDPAPAPTPMVAAPPPTADPASPAGNVPH